MLLTDKTLLIQRVKELEAELNNSQTKQPLERLTALIEGYFRLAVHPETPLNQALGYLMKASRLDASNPKYAYHMARLYFLHGLFDQAAEWLQNAVKLSPTNHRIWAHIALLQGELNSRYKGNTNYEPDDLKRMSDSILQRVREGQDNFGEDLIRFVPRPNQQDSTGQQQVIPFATKQQSERIFNPNTCRWTGVSDIVTERQLEAKPNRGALQAIKPSLLLAARISNEREGGISAFVILAIQWIVGGYPVSTIRTMWQRELGRATHTPALRLLETVIRLYETDIQDLPKALSIALETRAISLNLAALIHERRVLWQYGALRGGYDTFINEVLGRVPRLIGEVVAFIQEEKLGDFDRLTDTEKRTIQNRSDTLLRALENRDILALFQSAELPTIADDSDDELVENIAPEQLRTMFEAFESQLKEFETCRNDIFNYTRGDLESAAKNTENASVVYADVKAITALVEAIVTLIEFVNVLQSKVQNVIEKLGAKEAPEDYSNRREALQTTITQIGQVANIKKFAGRIEKNLPPGTVAAPEGSSAIKAFEERMLAIKGFLDNTLTFFTSAEKSQAASPGSMIEFFEELETLIQNTQNLKSSLFDYLRDNIQSCVNNGTNLDDVAQAKADLERIESMIIRFEDFATQSDTALAKIQRVLEKEGAEQAPESYMERQEVLKNSLTEIRTPGNFNRAITRLNRRIAELSVNGANSSPQIHEFEAQLNQGFEFLATKLEAGETPADENGNADGQAQDIFAYLQGGSYNPSPSSKSDAEEAPAFRFMNSPGLQMPSEAIPSHLQKLQKALQDLHDVMQKMFEGAISSFDHYGADADKPPLQYLVLGLRSAYAELLYRLGDKEAARWHWNAIFCQDRLNAQVALNIAVADTLSGNRRDMLVSWKNYADLLYLYAVATEDASFYASERAEFHRIYANAFAPSCLSLNTIELYQQTNTLDRHEVLEFLSNPAAVRRFVDHKILEFFNRRLTYKSPLNLIGRSRSEGRSEAGIDKLRNFAEQALSSFDGSSHAAFLQAAVKKFERADEICKNPELITAEADRYYALEEQQRIEWLAEVFRLKLKIVRLLEIPKLSTNLMTVVGLIELKRLNTIPLDISAYDLTAVPNHLNGLENRFWAINNQRDVLTHEIDTFVAQMLQEIYTIDPKADAASKAQRERKYQRMVKYWFDKPQFALYLKFCNRGFLEAEMKDVPEDERLRIAKHYVDVFPGLTGPAEIAANLLMQRQQYESALTFISKAIERCEHRGLLLDAHKLRLKVAKDFLDKNKNTAPQATPFFATVREDSEYILRYDEFNLGGMGFYILCVDFLLKAKAHETAYKLLETNNKRFGEESIRGLISYLFLVVIEHCRKNSLTLPGLLQSQYEQCMVEHAQNVIEHVSDERFTKFANEVIDAFGANG